MKALLSYHKVLVLSSLVLLMGLLSCSKQEENLIKELEQVIETQSAPFRGMISGKDVLIIIPRTGCSGCIGIADTYYKERTYDPSKAHFVFTGISSLKTLKIRMGQEVTDTPHVFIDSKGAFASGQLKSIYPLIAFMQGGKIEELQFLSPDKKHLIYRLREELSINLILE